MRRNERSKTDSPDVTNLAIIIRYVPSKFLGDKTTTEMFRDGMKAENYGPTRWHECVSAVINSCLEDKECTKDNLLETAASMPFLVDVGGALSDINKCKIEKQCGQSIISDGNDLFISAFLEKNEMEGYFTHGIETNSGIWEDGLAEGADEHIERKFTEKLKIIGQSAKYGGHSCKSCPPNLCKSQALRDILTKMDQTNIIRPKIVYIGDGSNDACPGLHVLSENDILLARYGKKRKDPNSLSGLTSDEDSIEEHAQRTLHPEMHGDEFESHVGGAFSIWSTLHRAKVDNGLEPKCQVYAWRSGRQLRSIISQILDGTLSTSNRR